MAYKFQLGAAVLSGALDQEGDVVVLNGGDPTKGNISGSRDLSFAGSLKVAGVSLTSAELSVIDGVTAGTLTAGKAAIVDSNKDLTSFRSITGSGDVDFANGRFSATVNAPSVVASQLTGTLRYKLSKAANSGLAMTDFNNSADVSDLAVDLNSLSAGVLSVANDHFAFIDADGNGTKKEKFSDMIDLINGNGLLATDGVLAINEDDSTLEINANELRVKDDGITGAKLHPDVAGLALGQDGSGNLDVQVSGAIAIGSDKLGITGSFAGIGLSYDGPVGHITGIDLDLNELTDAAIADGDSFAFIDSNDSNVTKKGHVADVAALFAGAGLAASNSVIAVANATNGGLDVQANDVAVDINNLAAAGVDVAADFIAFSDEGTAGDPTKKVSIANLVTAMAGGGLTATDGVISTQAGTVTAIVDATTTLTEGYNYATGSAAVSVALPIDNSIGDVVTVKALEAGEVTINRAGGQTIDGGTSIILESPGAAVTCVYLKSGSWGIV